MFILDTIRSFVSCFDYIHFSHIKRMGNKVAHALADYQPYSTCYREWCGNALDHIAALALKDLCIDSDFYQ